MTANVLRGNMVLARTRIAFLLLTVGIITASCSKRREFPASYSVYQVVLTDLVATVEGKGIFDGRYIAVSFNQCEFSTVGFASSLSVEKSLLTAFSNANKDKQEFRKDELVISGVRVEEIPSFDARYYYREGNKPDNLKCVIQFWHAGFSEDGKTAVVKFLYGPTAHSAIGTYILRKTHNGWTIDQSIIDYYL